MSSSEREAQYGRGVLTTALWAVVIVTLPLALLSLKLFGVSGLVGSVAGGAIAFVNLWAVMHIVRGLLSSPRTRSRWSLLAVFKFGLLIAVVFALVSSGMTPIFPLAIGYAALPIGIVIGQLWAAAPESDEPVQDKG
jgi:hypothetical protein